MAGEHGLKYGRGVTRVVPAVLVVLACAGCSSSPVEGHSLSANAVLRAARPLTLRAVPVARLDPIPTDCRSHGQTSEGTYPQIERGTYYKEAGLRVVAERVRRATIVHGAPFGTVASYMSVIRATGQFALTAMGMVVGYTPLLGPGNRTTIFLPYSRLKPLLSPTGQRLVSAIAVPRWTLGRPDRP